jgi:hypothetical protein
VRAGGGSSRLDRGDFPGVAPSAPFAYCAEPLLDPDGLGEVPPLREPMELFFNRLGVEDLFSTLNELGLRCIGLLVDVCR